MAIYLYTKALNSVNSLQLSNEIRVSLGDNSVSFTNKDVSDNLKIKFSYSLTSQQQQTLTTIVGNHDPVFSPEVIENPLKWYPPNINMGDGVSSGTSVFTATGCGIYWSFSGLTNDAIFFEIPLENNQIVYDGSSLAIKLHWRLSQNAINGDVVKWVVSYAFLSDGENGMTKVTNLATQDVLVTGKLQDIMFETQLGTMVGSEGAKTLSISLTRNSLGGGSDTFAGNARVIGIKLIKV